MLAKVLLVFVDIDLVVALVEGDQYINETSGPEIVDTPAARLTAVITPILGGSSAVEFQREVHCNGPCPSPVHAETRGRSSVSPTCATKSPESFDVAPITVTI